MGMGMMYPDSLYCQFRFLPLDSLHHPIDSSFICWRRLQLGNDSIHFGYMQCDSGYGTGNYMMGFIKGIRCTFPWDSTLVDSLHRMWRPTGVRCWNGTSWVIPTNVSLAGNNITIVSSQLYAAIAVVGEPSGVTSVSGKEPVPLEFQLEQNYPNPFNPVTSIGFRVARTSFVTLKVYNVLGEAVETIVQGAHSAGEYRVEWNSRTLPSGVYFYSLQAGSYTSVKKMMLLK
jgi:hypothetical protein